MGIDADSRSILNKQIRRYPVGIKDSIINNRDWNRDIYIDRLVGGLEHEFYFSQ